MDLLAYTLLTLNMLWFGAGAWQFILRAKPTSYGLVGREDATERGRQGVAGSIRFLGGLNLALAAMAAMMLLRGRAFTAAAAEVGFATFLIAHASQFLVNMPVAIREARGLAVPWSVRRRMMRMIFIIDGVLSVLNAIELIRAAATAS